MPRFMKFNHLSRQFWCDRPLRVLPLQLWLGVTLAAVVGWVPAAIALQLEDQGPEVEALQQQLQEAGFYNGPITGYFGELTQEALIEFQRANGLTPDGVVGEATQAALSGSGRDRQEEPLDVGGLVEGTRGPEVAELQTLLREAGYFNGDITGYFGSETTSAVQRFQTDNNLTVDGIAGPRTMTALRNPASVSTSSAATTGPSRNDSSSPQRDGSLRRGAQGDQVRLLQEKLGLLGFYRGTSDGRYDVLTEAAVLEFQQVNQLPNSGIADSATLTQIETQVLALARQANAGDPARAAVMPPAYDVPALPSSAVSPTSSYLAGAAASEGLRPGFQGPAVAELQNRLKELGFYRGPLNGVYGAETETAVRQFQRSQNLADNGVANPATLAAMLDSNTVPQLQPPETITAPDGTTDVLRLQQRLQDMELYSAPVDGLVGPNTDAAIRAAQERYGIEPSDIVIEER